jgi:dihydrofolate reductase
MRKVIAEIAISLDGFIEGPNGALDWLVFDEEVPYSSAFLKGFDTIFYGRVAYERFGVPRSENPSLPEGEREFNEMVNNMRKYVFSRTAKHVQGNGMMINNHIESEVKRIRDEEGKNIWLCGGAGIYKTFIDLDLIDEYQLAIQPRVLGSGKPLFRNLATPLNLKLLRTENLKSGVVRLHYQPESRMNKEVVLINKHANDRSF